MCSLNMPWGVLSLFSTVPLHLQQGIKFCWNIIKSGNSALTTASLGRTYGKLQDIKVALVSHSVTKGVLSKIHWSNTEQSTVYKLLRIGVSDLHSCVTLLLSRVTIGRALMSLEFLTSSCGQPCLFNAQVLPLNYLWLETPPFLLTWSFATQSWMTLIS